MNLKIIITLIVVCTANYLHAQKISVEEYIALYKDLAIEEMKRSGVPASITLAQGILETEHGNSDLVIRSNNHFGIKCKKEWMGERVFHDDDLRGECFRKYASAADSYKDHSDFLKGSERYAFLFKINPTDYKAWAWGLKKAGYATNPKYAITLIKHIENYNLNDYTLIALGKLTQPQVIIAKADEPKKETVEVKKDEALKQETIKEDKINTEKGLTFVNNVTVNEQTQNSQIVSLTPEKKVEDENPINQPATVIAKIDLAPKTTIPQPVENKMDYPSGTFKINETKVIYATKGTSLLTIAEANNIPLKYLIDFNELKNDNVLEKDQLIFIQRKRTISDKNYHIVKAGESLYDIAQVEGIRLDYLLKYNLLTSAALWVAEGEKLNLQSMALSAPKIVSTNNTPNKKTYLVQPKETLYSISKKLNVSIEELKQLNNLSSNDVKAGQELIIKSN